VSGYDDFESYTVVVYQQERPAGAPDLDEDGRRELLAGHRAFLAEMRAAGELLHNGRFVGGGGLCFYACDVEKTRALVQRDPYLIVGDREVEIYTWQCPPGVVSFNTERN